MSRPFDRRTFLRAAGGAGALCFWPQPRGGHGEPCGPHFRPRARRVLYLYMSGGPSQHDLWAYKPALAKWHGQDLPESVRGGQRITTMTSGQARLRIAQSRRTFQRAGNSGAWISDLLPHTARVVDELAVIRSLQTDAINHEPAINLIQTGSEQPGRPSFGAWLTWALGSEADDLPGFVVLHSKWSGPKVDQPLYSRLWGAGFLPAQHQGTLLRSQGDPVLFLQDPPGVSRQARRQQLDALAALNGECAAAVGDADIDARVRQYELAYRMQRSVPALVDVGDEPASVLALYGDDVHRPGTFAANALLARRLLERGVRTVQIYHRGWDQHRDLARDLPSQCRDVDQACAALLVDLRQRGLLDDTLVIWMSEFGRTVYAQGDLDTDGAGRDHHPRCFSGWLAGGGVHAGVQHGETDELGYNVVHGGVHVHDLNATLLHLLGFDHEKLTFRYQGRDFRLTDVHGRVVRELLA
jgi:hypothetical protein